MSLEEARRLLAGARSVAALTGAGVSAESGLATFRGAEGLWKGRRPEDLATPEAFARDPKRVWEWYEARRRAVAAARPNAAHEALAALEARRPGFTLITQNVDGLHTRAGSRRVLEIHGCLWRTRCCSCGEVREDRRVPLPAIPPRCACEGLLRPDVVWFGEPLPFELLSRAFRAVDACDVLIVAGTSGAVQPAGSMGLRALARGAAVIEVNVERTPLSEEATVFLEGRAGEVLPVLAGPA
ncbi:MAG TPA: NAD-dependent protein deacylase [Planctomycetota bacterium]|nr:NAD-dependent protein deacylase [Planctomycetota bacterium]